MATPYAHPESIVDADWLSEHLEDPGVRIVEVDVDASLYDKGHIPGAVAWNWTTQLNDPVRRDIVGREDFERLLAASGVTPDTTVVLYGDNHNWFAAFALWLLKLYGHEDARILDGGRRKWETDRRPFVTDVPDVQPTEYGIREVNDSLRATRDHVFESLEAGNRALVDVRSPDEFTGKVLAPPGLNETAQRPGHIPGAVNVPWAQAVNEDGTFKSREALEEVYARVGDAPEVITYCRIGERAAHTWFVHKFLLGRENVRNYDGSWTEWGNLIGAPVALGEE